MGVITAIGLAIHNFPEGLATFVATLDDPSVGIPIGFAIAIHNIPEVLVYGWYLSPLTSNLRVYALLYQCTMLLAANGRYPKRLFLEV